MQLKRLPSIGVRGSKRIAALPSPKTGLVCPHCVRRVQGHALGLWAFQHLEFDKPVRIFEVTVAPKPQSLKRCGVLRRCGVPRGQARRHRNADAKVEQTTRISPIDNQTVRQTERPRPDQTDKQTESTSGLIEPRRNPDLRRAAGRSEEPLQ